LTAKVWPISLFLPHFDNDRNRSGYWLIWNSIVEDDDDNSFFYFLFFQVESCTMFPAKFVQIIPRANTTEFSLATVALVSSR
jgi:hypothetical protein